MTPHSVTTGSLPRHGVILAAEVGRTLVYTRKESGDVAAVKTARLVYTVREGKIVRYVLENPDDSEIADAPSD